MISLGSVAEVFGRRPVLLGSIALFAIGSAVCGSATNITTLIIGRSKHIDHRVFRDC